MKLIEITPAMREDSHVERVTLGAETWSDGYLWVRFRHQLRYGDEEFIDVSDPGLVFDESDGFEIFPESYGWYQRKLALRGFTKMK